MSEATETSYRDFFILRARVEDFYFREAALLDERRFDEWLDLIADDVHYWMPLRAYRRAGSAAAVMAPAKELSGTGDVSLFDESKETLAMRVARLKTGKAWAEEPPSRTRRLVANVTIAPAADGELAAVSNIAVFQGRAHAESTVFYGQRSDLLRPVGDGFLLHRRHIILDNELHAGNLSIFF